MAYVYRHIRTDKNIPFYIGISLSSDGYKRANCTYGRNKIWYDITNKTEFQVEIVIDGITPKEAKKKEVEFIELYGRLDLGNGILCNMTDGGDGTINRIITEKERLNRSNARKGIIFTDEWKKKLSEAHKGKKVFVSNDTRKKISKNMKGRKPHKNTIFAVKKSNTGRILTREHKAKLGKGVINIKTGEKYISIKEASDKTSINYRTLLEYLNGSVYNKTDLRLENNDISITSPKQVFQKGSNNPNAKKVLDASNGIIYGSVIEASNKTGYTVNQLYQWLSGRRKNKSTLIYT